MMFDKGTHDEVPRVGRHSHADIEELSWRGQRGRRQHTRRRALLSRASADARKASEYALLLLIQSFYVVYRLLFLLPLASVELTRIRIGNCTYRQSTMHFLSMYQRQY